MACWAPEIPVWAMAAAPATASSRFLGLAPARSAANPSAVSGLNLSTAPIHCGIGAWSSPRGDDQAPMPQWMGAVDKFKPLTALGFAALLAGANPKNLLLAVAGAAAIAQTGISGAQQAIAYLIFALIAAVGVAAPVVIYFGMGDRSQEMLTRLKDWMGHNNAVIMSVLCLIIGAKLIGDAISGLTG